MSVHVRQRIQTILVTARAWKPRADFGVRLLCQRPVRTKRVQNRNGRPITSSRLWGGGERLFRSYGPAPRPYGRLHRPLHPVPRSQAAFRPGLAHLHLPAVSLWYTFSAMRFWGCRSGGWVGELQWTALPYTSSLLKSAAPRPRSPKPSKGSHHLRLNSPSRTGEPNPTPNPLSRFGRLLQNAAAQDGCRPAEQVGLADEADPATNGARGTMVTDR
jgi:hypothetical protein